MTIHDVFTCAVVCSTILGWKALAIWQFHIETKNRVSIPAATVPAVLDALSGSTQPEVQEAVTALRGPAA